MFFLPLAFVLFQKTAATADMNRCFSLQEMSPDRKSAVLQLSENVLSDFYAKNGDCKRVVHADSFALNGECNDINIHADNQTEWQLCRDRFVIRSDEFIRCRWNEGNVIKNTHVSIGPSSSFGTVDIELFDNKHCTERIGIGSISAVSEPPPSDLSLCLNAVFDSHLSVLNLAFKNPSEILSQFFLRSNICGELVRTSSVMINDVCFNAPFYRGGRSLKQECRNQVWAGDRAAYKNCVFSEDTVHKQIALSPVMAQMGQPINVEMYARDGCHKLIMSGILPVS